MTTFRIDQGATQNRVREVKSRRPRKPGTVRPRRDPYPDNTPCCVVAISLPESELDALDALAASDGVQRTTLIRRAIVAYMKRDT